VLAVDIDDYNNRADSFFRDTSGESLEARSVRHVLADGIRSAEAILPAALRRVDHDCAVIDTPPAFLLVPITSASWKTELDSCGEKATAPVERAEQMKDSHYAGAGKSCRHCQCPFSQILRVLFKSSSLQTASESTTRSKGLWLHIV
jgi:hypothetical protein